MKTNTIKKAIGLTCSLASTLGILLTLFIQFGCQSGSDTGSAKGDSAGVPMTVVPSAPVVSSNLTVSVNQAELYRNFAWAVTGDAGQNIQACDSSNQPTISCRFDAGGHVTFAVQMVDRNGNAQFGKMSFAIVDPGALANQPPSIVADFFDVNNVNGGGSSSPLATYANKPALNAGSMNVFAGTYQLRLSRTTDDHDAASAITFELNLDGAGFHSVAATSNLTLDQRTHNLTIRATDSAGAASTKSFAAYIKCDNSVSQPSIDTSKISIQPSPTPATDNFFTFKATAGTVIGGRGPFQYKWDANGDGVQDNDWLTEAQNQAGFNTYVIYAGQRNVGLQVWDTGCNFFTPNTTVSHTFVIPEADTSQSLDNLLHNDGGYYYIQGAVRPIGTNPALDKVQNADVVAKMLAPSNSPDGLNHVQCGYAKVVTNNSNTQGSDHATFSIYGWNQYTRADGAVIHGIALDISGIIDPNGTGTTSGIQTIDATHAYITDAGYTTDGEGDVFNSLGYSKAADCTLQMEVINATSQTVGCASNGDAAYTVQIVGKYSCPNMVDQNGDRVSVGLPAASFPGGTGNPSGAFRCDVMHVRACVGGSGGTGGGPPPNKQ